MNTLFGYQFALFLMRIDISDSVVCPTSSGANCECTRDEPCEFKCIGDDMCQGVDIFTCRSSQPCSLHCEGEQACTNSTLVPNGAHSVSLECIGDNACDNAEIVYESNATYTLTINSGCSTSVPATTAPSLSSSPTRAPLSLGQTHPPSVTPLVVDHATFVPTPAPTAAPSLSPTAAPTPSPVTTGSHMSTFFHSTQTVAASIFCIAVLVIWALFFCRYCQKQRRARLQERVTSLDVQEPAAGDEDQIDMVSMAESSNPPNGLEAELAAGAAVESSIPSQQQQERVELQIEDADAEDLYIPRQERDGNDRETAETTAGFIKESSCASSSGSNNSSEVYNYAAPSGDAMITVQNSTRST